MLLDSVFFPHVMSQEFCTVAYFTTGSFQIQSLLFSRGSGALPVQLLPTCLAEVLPVGPACPFRSEMMAGAL